MAQADDQNEHLARLLSLALEQEESASSRLKSRLYTALVRATQETGTLQTLTQSKAAGRDLCAFETLVQIAPIGDKAKAPFFCWTCHARIMGEHWENAPVFWEGCPYAAFQKRSD
ncbi:MAG: hypothetical protein ABI145_01795 [Steroidobacteraceae bacterium]